MKIFWWCSKNNFLLYARIATPNPLYNWLCFKRAGDWVRLYKIDRIEKWDPSSEGASKHYLVNLVSLLSIDWRDRRSLIALVY